MSDPGPDTSPEIPQQPELLTEATTDSLAELFNRDPEGLSAVDIATLVSALRAQREKWAASEETKATAGPRSRSKPVNRAASLVSQFTAKELDL